SGYRCCPAGTTRIGCGELATGDGSIRIRRRRCGEASLARLATQRNAVLRLAKIDRQFIELNCELRSLFSCLRVPRILSKTRSTGGCSFEPRFISPAVTA